MMAISIVLKTVLLNFRSGVKVCVRGSILLQFIADILWIFIIGYFKTFSNAISNFDSYGISIDFSDDNSKTSISSIAWFILMILLLQILKHFLLLLQLLILKLLVTLLLGFISIVRVYIDCESLCMGTSLYDSTPL